MTSFNFQVGLIRDFCVSYAHLYLKHFLTSMKHGKKQSHLAPWCIAYSLTDADKWFKEDVTQAVTHDVFIRNRIKLYKVTVYFPFG